MQDIKPILEKLEKLETLINKNFENADDLFPKHWLILLTVKDTLEKKREVPRENLESMNKIWKINKLIEKAGSAVKFESEVWEKIKKLTPALGWDGNKSGFDDMPKACKLFKESFVNDDGTDFSLSEIQILIKEKNGNS